MNRSRLDVQNSFGTRRGGSTGLFGQECHGEGFVEDSKLSVCQRQERVDVDVSPTAY